MIQEKEFLVSWTVKKTQAIHAQDIKTAEAKAKRAVTTIKGAKLLSIEELPIKQKIPLLTLRPLRRLFAV